MQKSKEDTMAKLGSIELKADQDIAKGNKIPFNRLFLGADLWRTFQLLEDVQNDKTKIRVAISKCDSFKTKANATKKRGEVTSCVLLLSRDDLARKIIATDDIKKGEKLMVALETL
jgi:hypothetical protein